MKVLIADDHPLFRAALAKLGARNRTQASLVFRELEIRDSDQLTLE